jgi:hypothetical protein
VTRDTDEVDKESSWEDRKEERLSKRGQPARADGHDTEAHGPVLILQTTQDQTQCTNFLAFLLCLRAQRHIMCVCARACMYIFNKYITHTHIA